MDKQAKVVSVQVMPFIEDPAAYDSPQFITDQPEGPTRYTSGFFVRLRMDDPAMRFGIDAYVKTVAMVTSQEDADFVAQAYATKHGVEVEPQKWKQA